MGPSAWLVRSSSTFCAPTVTLLYFGVSGGGGFGTAGGGAGRTVGSDREGSLCLYLHLLVGRRAEGVWLLALRRGPCRKERSGAGGPSYPWGPAGRAVPASRRHRLRPRVGPPASGGGAGREAGACRENGPGPRAGRRRTDTPGRGPGRREWAPRRQACVEASAGESPVGVAAAPASGDPVAPPAPAARARRRRRGRRAGPRPLRGRSEARGPVGRRGPDRALGGTGGRASGSPREAGRGGAAASAEERGGGRAEGRRRRPSPRPGRVSPSPAWGRGGARRPARGISFLRARARPPPPPRISPAPSTGRGRPSHRTPGPEATSRADRASVTLSGSVGGGEVKGAPHLAPCDPGACRSHP